MFCYNCGKEISSEQVHCENCIELPEEVSIDIINFCPECNNEIVEINGKKPVFCSKCGFNIQEYLSKIKISNQKEKFEKLLSKTISEKNRDDNSTDDSNLTNKNKVCSDETCSVIDANYSNAVLEDVRRKTHQRNVISEQDDLDDDISEQGNNFTEIMKNTDSTSRIANNISSNSSRENIYDGYYETILPIDHNKEIKLGLSSKQFYIVAFLILLMIVVIVGVILILF